MPMADTASIDFESYTAGLPVADSINFADGASMALYLFSGTPPSAEPLVQSDAGGKYAAAGTAVYAVLPAVVPTELVTRVSSIVDLPDGDEFRLIFPISDPLNAQSSLEATGPDDYWHAYVGVRRSGTSYVLSCYLNESYAGPFPRRIASDTIDADEGEQVLITLESSPGFMRAWIDFGGGAWTRRAPDISAMITDLEGDYWGFVANGSVKTRSFVVEREPAMIAEESQSMSVEVVLPDVGLGETGYILDDSRSFSLAYTTGTQYAKSRLVTAFLVAADGEFVFADHIFHRVDPWRTVLSVQDGDSTIVAVAVEDMVSGPPSAAFDVQDIDGDTNRTYYGGIGSGRPHLLVGGEPTLDLPCALQGSAETITYQDFIAGDGGQEARIQYANRPNETWQYRAKITGVHLRRLERLIANSGGVLPVWARQPFSPYYEPVLVGRLSAEWIGITRALVTFDQSSARPSR